MKSKEPQFRVSQMISATVASKQFGALREKAQIEPQFVLDHNRVDAVVMSYADYVELFEKAYSDEDGERNNGVN